MNSSISHIIDKNRSYTFRLLLGAIVFCILVYFFWSGFPFSKNKPCRLVIYAFSTQEEALTKGIFPAFKQIWEAEMGRELIIEGVFGPSGELTIQITSGEHADVAILSNHRHIDLLKFSKYVDRDTDPVVIASTALVILTRPGNPANISDFTDITQPGLQLLHGDPRNSGVGEWALLAEYGSAFLETGDHKIAEAQLKDIWQNVKLMGSSARTSLTLYELGAGDVLITYEQDAHLAQQRGITMEVILPQRTILARHFAVIVDDNVTSAERPVVAAFLAFIQSIEGQQIFKEYYFRPAALESDHLPPLIHPFTEEDLGGWTQAYDRIIEDYWKTEVEPSIELIPITSLYRER